MEFSMSIQYPVTILGLLMMLYATAWIQVIVYYYFFWFGVLPS